MVSDQLEEIERRYYTGVVQVGDIGWLLSEVERLRARMDEVQRAIRWLWGFWDGNTIVAAPGADREMIDEAWDKLLEVAE